jgi:Brp/Blh family beta-carotene 15,15'-monooxygenase
MSAYHFGESQLVNYNISSSFNKTAYFTWGVALMSALIFYNKNELITLFGSYEDTVSFNSLFRFKIIEIIFWTSNVSFILFFAFLTKTNRIEINTFASEFFQIALIHLTFILFPIIISFTLYFIFLHSIKVLTQEFGYIKTIAKDLSIFNFIKMLTPYTFISLAFIGVFLYISKLQIINMSLLLFAIISFSVITLPHSIVMTKFYKNFKKNS